MPLKQNDSSKVSSLPPTHRCLQRVSRMGRFQELLLSGFEAQDYQRLEFPDADDSLWMLVHRNLEGRWRPQHRCVS